MELTVKKKGFAVLFVGVLILSSTIGVVNAYDSPIETWTKKDSARAHTGYEWINAYTASSVGYFGAPWIPGRDVYEYNFRITGVGETRDDDGNPEELCRIQAVQIKETVNKGHQAIWTSTDKRYIGAWPHSGTNADYYDAAYAVASLAISAINSYAGFALSATSFVAALLSACDDKQDGETVWREWDYSPDQTDVGHWFWWLHDVDPNQEVKFTVDDYLFGPGYEMVAVGWTFVCTTPGPPGKMSAAEMEKYGIEKISLNELKKRADEHHIAPETVEELLKQGEPIYSAHNFPVVATPHHPEPPVFFPKIVEKLGEK
ncbi:MAG TPA: hypothetical protein C5S37_04170 [Methanophagales archaeon]|nr:hypothetical protein [Methanophagales archaeon]